jgi:peptidoglycan/LPS O-acetylase OafA/YrhL
MASSLSVSVEPAATVKGPCAAAGAPTLFHNRRDDIQGLRAIAIPAVIVFHATLPFPGGFRRSRCLLRHMWSLGVEEQSYLLFPMFLLLAWRTSVRLKRSGAFPAWPASVGLLAVLGRWTSAARASEYARQEKLPFACLLADIATRTRNGIRTSWTAIRR